MRKNEIDALGVGGIQAEALGDGLVKKDSLRAHSPAQIAESLQQLPPLEWSGNGP